MGWKLIGTGTGNYDFSKYNEIFIDGSYASIKTSIFIPVISLSPALYRGGSYMTGSAMTSIQTEISLTTIGKLQFFNNGSEITSGVTWGIYAR